MLLINAVNAEGRPVELYVKDGKIAAVGQDLAALAGENDRDRQPGGCGRRLHVREPDAQHKACLLFGSTGRDGGTEGR